LSIAAAFGKVHGVCKPGNVKLLSDLLGQHQAYTEEKLNKKGSNVCGFSFSILWR